MMFDGSLAKSALQSFARVFRQAWQIRIVPRGLGSPKSLLE